jgi:opacity protein-like surface antigen
MYSWELLDNLYAGGSVTYQLLDGLKKVYTYAKTIYRNVGGNIGLAYQLNEDIIIGAHYTFNDTQESIEAADVNLLEVETFNYRGETYFVPDRGSSVTQKIRKKASTFSGQLFWQVSDELQAAIQSNYTPSNSKVLIPEGSFKEVEEGYASFESFDVQLKSLYKFDDDLTVGSYAAYLNRDSWSRHSHKNLLLWEWSVKDLSIGVGSSYKFTDEVLVGIDYLFTRRSIDSTKYIDNRIADLNSNDHTIKLGLEYEVMENVLLRGGYSLNLNQYDIFYGGEKVKNHSVTLGIGIPIHNKILLDSYIRYSNLSPGNGSESSRSFLGAFVTLRLNSF